MGLRAAVQALKKAERLKEKVSNSKDLLNDRDAWICQQQLQKIYQQVLIIDLEYALDKKVEQDLWNHGFKKHIGTLQALAKDRKNPKSNESQSMLSWCLDAASGFYLTLLNEICSAFDLDLPFRRKNSLFGNFKKAKSIPFLNKPHKNSCYYICQHCLVHLGDIARYRNQCRQAEAFYRHAVELSPSSGQPYNQLALLEASRGDRLSTVFHYVRSVAVRHMFPAAASNLSLTFDKCLDQKLNVEGRTKLSSSEYVMLFLKLHAMFHLSSDLDSCAGYVQLLTETLTAHIATQSFSSWKLVQMLTINIFAYHHSIRDADNDLQLTANEKRIRSLVTHLIAGSLNAFLLPVYTFKQESSMLDYFALPAIKLTMEWIRLEPEALAEVGFTKRLQIWPGLCRLLNGLQTSLQQFSKTAYCDVPLPEDRDLQGFKLLEKSFNGLNFSSKELDTKVLMKLRACRLVDLGKWVAALDQPKLITAKTSEGSTLFEAIGGPQVAPSTEFLKVLEELSLSKGGESPSPSNTPSSRTSNATPELNNPAAELLAAFQSVQEKRAGILKPQPTTMEEPGTRGRSRQNVALQAILKRTQEQETKQVTFKTPSPSVSPHLPSPPATAKEWPQPPPLQSLPLPSKTATKQQQQQQQQFNAFPPPPPNPPPAAFHFPPPPPPPALDTRFPPPPVFAPPANPWQQQQAAADEKQRPPPLQPPPPLWWNDDRHVASVPQSPREPHPPPNSHPTQPPTMSFHNRMPLPHHELFGSNWPTSSMKMSSFSPIFSQPPPPPFNSAPDHPGGQGDPSHMTNTFSPTYSLFSPAWASHQQPSAQNTSAGGSLVSSSSFIGQQSLWSGPGPSPLERLLEQQKQLREGPAPKGGT